PVNSMPNPQSLIPDLKLQRRYRGCGKFPDAVPGKRSLTRPHHVCVIQIRHLHLWLSGDLEHASGPDDLTRDLNRDVHGLRTTNVRDVKIDRVAASTRDHVEAVGRATDADRVAADVMTIELHHPGHRLEIRAVAALGCRNDHRVVLPACAAEV